MKKVNHCLNCTSFAETTERAIVKLFRRARARHASREQGQPVTQGKEFPLLLNRLDPTQGYFYH